MVPMFKDADEDFLNAIVSMFSYEVFLEGDIIINAHTKGSTMYFIQHGEAHVINRNGQVIRVLVDGDYFGGNVHNTGPRDLSTANTPNSRPPYSGPPTVDQLKHQ